MSPSELLEFESRWPRHSPEKVQAIHHSLGISDVRYYVLLARAARSAEGIESHPLRARLVRETARARAEKRLRRVGA